MLSSRSYLLGRSVGRLIARQSLAQANLQTVRHGGHAVQYRLPPQKHPKIVIYGAQAASGLMWWWVLWHLWHEHEHITGEFEYPDPSSWTNAELGIPPDE